MTANFDWNAIRNAYEGGTSSLSALEREFGVSRQAIKKRASKENWVTPQLQVTVTPNNQEIINRDVNSTVRVTQAIAYRQSGWTFDRIAHQCGYGSPGAARNAIQRELNRVIVQNVEEWRNDHIARLEKMHEEAWTIAMDKSNKGRLFAFDRLLAIEERQAKLLGLDKKTDEDSNAPQVVVREVPVGWLQLPQTVEAGHE